MQREASKLSNLAEESEVPSADTKTTAAVTTTTLGNESSSHQPPLQASTGTLQDIRFGDDIDDEIQQRHHQNAAGRQVVRHLSATKPVVSSHLGGDNFQNEQQEDGKRKAAPRSRRTSTSKDASPSEAPVIPTRTPFFVHVGIFVALLFGITGTILGIVALVNSNNGDDDDGIASSSEAKCMEGEMCDLENNDGMPRSLLDTIVDRGYVNCGLAWEQPGFLSQTGFNSETQEPIYEGLDVDLCASIAAAIFDGDSEAYKPVVFPRESRWTAFNSTEVDVLFRTARTMQREIYEPEIGSGMKFSTPYFYDGLVFGGIEEFVECAENGISNGTCADLTVCVMSSEAMHQAIVREQMTTENIIVQTSEIAFYDAFPTVCNVLAGEQSWVAETTLRNQGYEGDYAVGQSVYSRDPLSMVTRRGDTTWTGFVEAVLNALVQAEEEEITQLSSSNMPSTELFGPRFERMFQHAVGARGNYGEIYRQNMDIFVPRSGWNRLNDGGTPRIWSFPFGDLNVEGPDLDTVSPTIKAIKDRGFVNCGLTPLLIFGRFDAVNKRYRGASADLCRAMSAALFGGVDRTLFTILPFPLRARTLQKQRVDVVLTAGHRLADDIKEGSTGQGLEFSTAYYFTGNAFGGEPFFVDCAERFDVFSPECQSLRICTLGGTALLSTFAEILRDDYVVPKDSPEAVFMGLVTGDCNTVLIAAVRLQATFARGGPNSTFSEYAVGTRLFSVSPLAMATREDDPVWSAFVDWIVLSMIYAEENGIDRGSAELMPRTNLFGRLGLDALYHAVNLGGNYAELLSGTFQRVLPRSGPHLLNDDNSPLQYSF